MKVLVTGGAGFVGCNTVVRLIRAGHRVFVMDNLSRRGTEKNLEWIKSIGPFYFIKQDVRDADKVAQFFREEKDIDAVFHLAGQVAVTTSITDPRDDMEINILGTFNVLEGIRLSGQRPFVLLSSTNKVYGKMADVPVVERDGRYQFDSLIGVGEDRPLDFYSPYGCSKGAADQYMRDYARIYGLDTCVFRMSCIYGLRQFGIEDQGWVAWFIIAAEFERPLTIYGDGKQVRDILFVDDLVDAYLAAWERRDRTRGRIYNVGGGPENQMSLLELIAEMEELFGREIPVSFADWRAGDQPIYVSRIDKLKADLGWSPKVGKKEGVRRLFQWVRENRELFDV